MKLIPLLKTLCEAFGPPGFEDDVRAIIRKQVKPLVDRIEEDAIGNMTAWRKGKSDRIVMLDAHTDEVGFMVSHVDDKGFIRFAPLGGWDARQFPGARVTLKGKNGFLAGAVGFKPPHITKPEERTKAIPVDDLTIDIGIGSKDEAEEMGIIPGTPGVLDGPFQELPGGRLLGKAFDDRGGCAAAIYILNALKGKELPFTLAVNFATSEELGLRGAKVSAYHIAPEIALVLETTTAGDVPGVAGHQSPCTVGSGVALTVADKTMVTSPRMLRFLQEVAQKRKIPHQLKQPLFGGTNAGEIHLSRSGVLTGVLATPSRYIHGPSSIIDLKDLESLIQLALAALEEIPDRLF
jgi:endoglucanase